MGCSNTPTEWIDAWGEAVPESMKKLRDSIANMARSNLGRGATPLPENFPLSATVNPLQLNAAQLMTQLMGGGDFQMSPYRTAGGMAGGGGGGGGNSNIIRTNQGNVNTRGFVPNIDPTDPSTWFGSNENLFGWRYNFPGEEWADSASGRGQDVWMNTPEGRVDPRRIFGMGQTPGAPGAGGRGLPSVGGAATNPATQDPMEILRRYLPPGYR